MTTPKETAKHSRGCRENLAKFFYDLAKLAFAATALGGAMNIVVGSGSILANILIGVSGLLITVILAITAYSINSKY